MLQRGTNNILVNYLSKELEEYPNLKKELQDQDKAIALQYVDEEAAKEIESEIEKETEEVEKKEIIRDPARFAGYDPSVIDFLRRCDTDEQAREIISYMENKGELSKDDSKKLLKQLQTQGLRSFGTKKKSGYYFKVED